MSAALQREHFSINRAAEYFSLDELRAQTGAPPIEFGHVLLKEFIDNGLDAAEMAGRDPIVDVRTLIAPSEILLSVGDNGDGIPDDIVTRLLDFATRTSNKEAYRSPTRGAQGNALKTALGIPIALGAPVTRIVIEGAGSRHEIEISVSIAGELEVSHNRQDGPTGGALITIAFPRKGYWTPRAWVEGFALFNPHARLSLTTFIQNSELSADWPTRAKCLDDLSAEAEKIEQMSLEPSGNPRKYNTQDATPAHWYSSREFERVAYLKARRDPSITVRQFVGLFKGMTRKATEISEGFPKLLADANAKTLHLSLIHI